jgi:hypothetical protein
MRIIYKNNDGVSVIVPAPKFLEQLGRDERDWTDEEKLVHLANKTLPTGTKYEITDEDLSDRTFRNAWEYVSGSNEKTSEDLNEEDLARYNMTENK